MAMVALYVATACNALGLAVVAVLWAYLMAFVLVERYHYPRLMYLLLGVWICLSVCACVRTCVCACFASVSALGVDSKFLQARMLPSTPR